MSRKLDFVSRRQDEQDKSARSGDFSKATQALLKVDAKANLSSATRVAYVYAVTS